jgi:hypothetical protein
MKNEFAPYELALRMKSLGFDEPCFGHYSNGELVYSSHTNNNMQRFRYSAPLYQQAFRWFREKYNLICRVSVTSYGCTLDEQEFYCVITSKYGTASYEIFNTYEEAELDCLEKLIEIVKSKKEK